MITSSSLKEEGFVGSEFLSVTPHKSCWPVNKYVVRARPLSGSSEGSVERVTGPGHNIRKTQGKTWAQRSQCVWSGHLLGTVHNR